MRSFQLTTYQLAVRAINTRPKNGPSSRYEQLTTSTADALLLARIILLVGPISAGDDFRTMASTEQAFDLMLVGPNALPRGDSLGSEKHASLENTLVRFKPDTKKCHNIFCQFMTTVHVL